MNRPDEERLAGGNVSAGVVRAGNTVRRPAGPWTPAVHALLRHLHAAGFAGAPRPLGIDEEGREVLSFEPGVVPWPDRFDLLEHDEALAAVARLIRRLHDAATGFVPPPDARWQVLIPPDARELVVHHDLAPWNLVVDGDRLAFIDWDCAGPGSRLWDVAYALHGFVPLSADTRWHHLDSPRRLRVFADAYGLVERERNALLPLLGRRARAMHDFLAAEAELGREPWVGLWQAGHGAAWLADAEWIETRLATWERALLGPFPDAERGR